MEGMIRPKRTPRRTAQRRGTGERGRASFPSWCWPRPWRGRTSWRSAARRRRKTPWTRSSSADWYPRKRTGNELLRKPLFSPRWLPSKDYINANHRHWFLLSTTLSQRKKLGDLRPVFQRDRQNLSGTWAKQDPKSLQVKKKGKNIVLLNFQTF